MIDLATLTGAIIVCLGSEYAGLFLIMIIFQGKSRTQAKKSKKSYGECHYTKITIN